MNETAHQKIKDLLPDYALGCLDEDEAAAVVAHLATCAECREELASYEMVTDSLATAVPIIQPPTVLKEHLLARTHTAVPSTPTRLDRLTAFFRSWRQRPIWQPALVLTLLAVIIAALFIWQQNNSAASAQYALSPTDAAPGASGQISVAADGSATLTINNLPPLASDQQYQLWLIDNGERDSGAIFSVNDDGAAVVAIKSTRPLTDYAAFGITIEPAGGSPGPTGERVLGYNL